MSHGNGRSHQIQLTKEIQRATLQTPPSAWTVAVRLVSDAAWASVTLNAIIFTALVNATVKVGLWDWAAKLLRTVRCRNVQVDNLLHNAVTRVFCAASQWCQAFLQLADLRVQSLSVDAHSTSAAMKAAEQGWQSATHVLSSLVDSDLEATVVNHNIVLSRFEKVSHWQPSLNLLHEMQCSWVEPTVISFASGISACDGHWEHSLLLSQELERSALQRNVISCNASVSACEKQGQWWQAMQMLDAMLRVGLQDDTISNNALISSCEKGGLWEQSLAQLTRIRSLNMLVTVVTCSAAISACATAACWQAALHVFYELLALEQSGLVPNSVTFNAAIIACEKGHRWENALNLMHEMHLRRLELDLITCNAVVNTCSYGRWQTAIKLLTDFQQQHVERDVITVEAAMKSFEHAGLGEYAVALLDELDTMFWK